MDPSPSGAVVRGTDAEVNHVAYDDADAVSSSDNEGSSSGQEGSERSDVDSMTGRGIKCLCSELLELKRSSDDDFQKNVRSKYFTFIRVLKEVGDVESEILELKRHISDQKRLVKDLTESFFNGSFSEDLLESKVENDLEVEDHLLSKQQTRSISILQRLDILSLDQQFEGALDILETEEKTLQKIDMQGDVIPLENSASCRSALSEWRARLADQLSSMAGHPRVTAPEFQKLLVLLFRLGETSRANSLLIRFYHSQLVKRLRDLQQWSKSLLNQLYLVELVKTTFSIISQAARSFVMLYGETSAYSSEFLLWVTDEIKMFTHYFDAYIKSSSKRNVGLSLEVESMRCAFFLCSLLESQRLVLHPYLIQSVRPCMEEAYLMHVDYLRGAIHVFTATDTWVLGKFIVPGVTRDAASLAGDGGKLEYCLLTSSGRKFVRLIEANLEDISPLCSLQMGNSILRGLADLFTEYIIILECAIPRCGNSVEEGSVRVRPAQKLSQQLSLLVNTWTLADYLYSVAKCISENVKISSDEQIADTCRAPRHEELDTWNFSIQNAADRLRAFILQQFVDRYNSVGAECRRTGLESYTGILGFATSPESPMPSSEFQMLFQQLRQLEKNGKPVFGGADERVKKLLDDLVDSLVAATSYSIKLWRYNEHSSPTREPILFEQVVLDVHFLVEIARFGGHLSDRLMEATRSLMINIQNTFLNTGSDISVVPDVAWASRYAESAIQKLVEMEATESESEKEHMDASEEEFDYETALPCSEHNSPKSVDLSDREVEVDAVAEADITKPKAIINSVANPLDGTIINYTSETSNANDYTSQSTAYLEGKDEGAENATKTWINESEENKQKETDLATLTMTHEEDDTREQYGHAPNTSKLAEDEEWDSDDTATAYYKKCRIYSGRPRLNRGLSLQKVGDTSAEENCLVEAERHEILSTPCVNNELRTFLGEKVMATLKSKATESPVDTYAKHPPLDVSYSTELVTSPAEHDFTLCDNFDASEESSDHLLGFIAEVGLTMEELSEMDGSKLHCLISPKD